MDWTQVLQDQWVEIHAAMKMSGTGMVEKPTVVARRAMDKAMVNLGGELPRAGGRAAGHHHGCSCHGGHVSWCYENHNHDFWYFCHGFYVKKGGYYCH